MLITLTVLVVSIFGLIYLWMRNRLSYWANQGIPSVKPILIFGNMRNAGKKHISEMTTECYNKLKGKNVIGGFYFLMRPILLILDIDLVKTILIKDFQYFHDRGIYFNEKDDPLSANLLTLEGQKWKTLRTKITPTFTSGKMKLMFGHMLKVGHEFSSYLNEFVESRQPVEARDVASRYNTDIIGTCAFGVECNSFKDPNAEFRRMGRKFVDLSYLKILKFLFMNTFGDFCRTMGVKFVDNDLSDYFTRVIRETIARREVENIKRNDFLDLMLQISQTGKIDDDEKELVVGKISFNEIAAQAFIFFIAGFESSSTNMTYCMYEVAKNSHIQERLREEILFTIGEHEGRISYDALMKMPYLDQVINEALRKYPSIESIPRITTKDYQVPGTTHIIEKGIVVLVPVYAIHHDPEFYPEPEKFDPDRFSEVNISKRPPFTFLPFGEGPRVCIGRRFALMQVRIGLVSLLTKYKLTIDVRTTEPLEINPRSPLIVPRSDIWLKLETI